MTMLRAGRFLATGQAICNVTLEQFWFRYLALGGTRSPQELLAYLLGQIEWPAGEHDAGAQALNELCHDLGLGLPVPYAAEL
jgi:hypothetical protein